MSDMEGDDDFPTDIPSTSAQRPAAGRKFRPTDPKIRPQTLHNFHMLEDCVDHFAGMETGVPGGWESFIIFIFIFDEFLRVCYSKCYFEQLEFLHKV